MRPGPAALAGAPSLAARTISYVWDEPFENDQLALAAFQAVVDEEGMTSFLDSATVIPFPSR